MTAEQLMFLLGAGAFGVGMVVLAMFLWDEPSADEQNADK